MGERVGRVEDGDVVVGAGSEVDLVGAGTGAADDDQVVGAARQRRSPSPRAGR